MTKLKARWLATAILAVACSSSAWGAPPAQQPPSRSWFSRMLGKPEPPPEKPVITAPLTGAALAEAVEAEKQAWTRRMQVCTELRTVAMARKDDALLRQIDELERQASIMYNQRTTALGVKQHAAPAASAVLDAQAGRSTGTDRTTLYRGAPR
jgi:hypothetical protein